MLASMIAAVVAALFYGVASVMQAVAVREASTRDPGHAEGVDPGLLVRMLHQWRFVASVGLDALGFVAQLVALQKLPLFAVQAIVAANLAVCAVVASRITRVKLTPREWAAVGGVVAGVGLLGSSAGAEGATNAGAVFKLALIVATAGIGLLGLAAARLPNPFRTPALGTIAGLGYGVLGIAARVLNGFGPYTLIRDPATYAVIAAGIISFMLYATALEGGSVTVTTAAVVLAETLPPAIIGILFLGDQTRPGLEPAAIAGFVLAVACAVQLARFGEADHPEQTRHADGQVAQVSQVTPPGLLSWWPVDLRFSPHRIDHGRDPSWARQTQVLSICSSPVVWPPASARASPHPASAACSRCAGCGSRCRNSTPTSTSTPAR